MSTDKERADLGFGAAVDNLDPEEWNPKKQRTANDRPPKEAVEKAAESSGFVSREPKRQAKTTPPPKARGGEGTPMRRRRTGRNVQFNMRATQDAIDRFVAVADRRGWVLGETLEMAVALLEEKYGKR